jgi:hypothetical protein
MKCEYCGGDTHTGLCPRIQSVIHHPDGTVEYRLYQVINPYVAAPIVVTCPPAGIKDGVPFPPFHLKATD